MGMSGMREDGRYGKYPWLKSSLTLSTRKHCQRCHVRSSKARKVLDARHRCAGDSLCGLCIISCSLTALLLLLMASVAAVDRYRIPAIPLLANSQRGRMGQGVDVHPWPS